MRNDQLDEASFFNIMTKLTQDDMRYMRFSFLPAIGYQRKDGHCPSVLPDHYMTAAKLCNGDADCFGSEKCCPTDLTFRCLGSHRRRAEPKEGSCKDAVPDKRPYSILGPLCEDDYDCIGMKKCCFNFLAEECMNPVL
ncbi:hypothetical protein M514_20511 [Trichuris suis]|uniref:WAP domain-containing protein n=1 Tax=Trichuris suis TaxID=68888 RepID=A0A085NCR6_9BILA|nr:hypothetical protein M514_20511 [Trichuris suis]